MAMTLSQYIKNIGDAQCAKLFGVKERTVASWRRGENYPRANKAREIVVLTKGAVSLDGIFHGAA
jgi:transcriptional regulator with XRE-family HTH domain